jgi:hypothetical protein
MEDILIFVDGELYKGVAEYCNYKGVGWPGGRTQSLRLIKDKAARYQEVHIVYLHFNKLRKCKYNDQGYSLKDQLSGKFTFWDVIDMPGD